MKKLILIINLIILSISWAQVTPQAEIDAQGYSVSTLEKAKFNVDASGNVTVQILLTDSLGNFIRASNPLPVTSLTTAPTDGYTANGDGRKVVASAATAEALATTTACKRVDITAEFNNTGVIVVGGSTVVADLATRRGVPLYAGSTYTVLIEDLADVYIDATVSTDGVTYTYYE